MTGIYVLIVLQSSGLTFENLSIRNDRPASEDQRHRTAYNACN